MVDGLINFNQEEVSPTIIKVIGVGGGGGNAVEYMYEQGIHDVDFVLCNTDAQVLKDSQVTTCIQLGKDGLGAGNRMEKGEEAANESLDQLQALLSGNTKMVFITASMGGGTGTGAAPVLAKLAKEMGILTVGVVTIPMRFEGPKRLEQAKEGIRRLKNYVDSLIIIDTEKIKQIYGAQTLTAAFSKANDVLNTAVKGVAEIITLSGYINVDFADVCTVMRDSGVAVMGAAVASGENRAKRVIEDALNSPLLNKNDILGASNILLNITSGTDEITMDEMTVITSHIVKEVGDSAAVIWGVGTDENLGDAISITIIATGFSMKNIEETLFDVSVVSPGREEEKEVNKVPKYNKLRRSEVVLQPDLSEEMIEELESTPAYERRKPKIDNV